MIAAPSLLPGRLLRRPGPPEPLAGFCGVQVRDEKFAAVLAPDAAMLVLHEGTVHGEGPVWDGRRERLLWSDIPNRRLLGWYPDGRVEVVVEGTWFVNGNALAPDGTSYHCEHGRRCLSRSDGDGFPEPVAWHYRGKRLNAPNDVCVAPDGAVWFTDPMFGILMPNQGSLADPELDHRSVYRLDPGSGALERMADFEQPNGVAFAPGGRTLYVTDTSASLNDVPGCRLQGTARRVEAFDVAPDGRLAQRRTVFQAAHGVPDGLAVDARGWVWIATADGVHVIEADGAGLGSIPTPSVAANCCFGGREGSRLFIAASDRLLAIDLRGGS